MTIAYLNSIPQPTTPAVVTDLAAYDPIWGFFTFSQAITDSYNDADVYRSEATFTINGVFTATGEGVDPDADPTGALLAMTSKYDALEAMFDAAAVADMPNDPADWYTDLDDRCIAIPSPIADKNNKPLLALPEQLVVQEAPFPLYLRYQATLKEGVFPYAVVLINDIPLTGARLGIVPPRPIAVRHRMIAGEGSSINVRNYTQTEVSISGLVPLQPGDVLSVRAASIKALLIGGIFSISIVQWGDGGPVTTLLFPSLLADGPSLDVRPEARGVTVVVKGLV